MKQCDMSTAPLQGCSREIAKAVVDSGGFESPSLCVRRSIIKGDLDLVTSASCDTKEEVSTDEQSPPTVDPVRLPVAPPVVVSSSDGHLASRRDYIECSIIFTILGCLAGFFWEAMLNCLPTICAKIFPSRPTFSDDVTAIFNTAILLAAGILTVCSPLHRWILLSASAVLSACSVLIGLFCSFEEHRYEWIPMSMLIVNFVAGLASGFAESSTFAYALCLHSTRFAGCFSVGFGLSGILSVVCWMLWSRVLWPDTDLYSAQRCIWAQQIVSALIAFISFGAFIRFTHIESYKLWKAELPSGPSVSSLLSPLTSQAPKPSATSLQSADLEGYDHHDEAKAETPLWEVIKATSTCQFHLGLVLFITYALVPNLVPLVLLDSSHQQDILVAVYQITDFIGRFGANLENYAAWIKIRLKWLVPLSYGRLILLSIGLRLIVSPLSLGMSLFWVQLVFTAVVGLTNGWFLTLFMMYLGGPLTKDHDKGRATAVSVMTQLLGVVFGLYFANIAKSFYLPLRQI